MEKTISKEELLKMKEVKSDISFYMDEKRTYDLRVDTPYGKEYLLWLDDGDFHINDRNTLEDVTDSASLEELQAILEWVKEI